VPECRVYNPFSNRDRPAESVHRAANHHPDDGHHRPEHLLVGRSTLGVSEAPMEGRKQEQPTGQQYMHDAHTEKQRTGVAYHEQMRKGRSGQQVPCSHHQEHTASTQEDSVACLTRQMDDLGGDNYILHATEARSRPVRDRELPVWLKQEAAVEYGGMPQRAANKQGRLQNKFEYGDEGTFAGSGPATMEDSGVSQSTTVDASTLCANNKQATACWLCARCGIDTI